MGVDVIIEEEVLPLFSSTVVIYQLGVLEQRDQLLVSL